MKLKPIIFVISLVVCIFLLQFFFDFGTKHNLNIKASYVSLHKLNNELIILGPCEPLWIVASDIITKKTNLSCYNLANVHSDFADNYLHLYLYLKNNDAPKYLLLYVTPESFDTNYNTFYSYRFSPFLNDSVVSNVVKECDKDFYRCTKIPFAQWAYYSHQTFFNALQGWKHFFTKRTQPYYPNGFEPPAKIVWDNHYELLKQKYPAGYHFNWNTRREKYLLKILSLCKEKNVRVLLYESPILKTTAGNQPNRAEIISHIKNIAQKENIDFVSFQNLSMANDKKNYISPMVTTLQGSYLFSDTLGNFLRDYWEK